MKTLIKNINNQKNKIMYRLTFLFSLCIALNAGANINNDSVRLNSEEHKLEKIVFNNIENSSSTVLDVSAIEVIELDEEVDLGLIPPATYHQTLML